MLENSRLCRLMWTVRYASLYPACNNIVVILRYIAPIQPYNALTNCLQSSFMILPITLLILNIQFSRCFYILFVRCPDEPLPSFFDCVQVRQMITVWWIVPVCNGNQSALFKIFKCNINCGNRYWTLFSNVFSWGKRLPFCITASKQVTIHNKLSRL